MTLIVDGTTGVTFNDSSLQGAAASPFGLKNRIINGDMVIDQRNNGAEITSVNNTYCLDRWNMNSSTNGIYKVQQNAGSVTPPPNFRNYLGVTVLSAVSVTGFDSYTLNQRIEGFNVADLGWGTASAATITLSFWVRSSLTGTFGGAVSNSAVDRSYPFTYTISSANTWQYKTVTIPGDTTGTWLTTNGNGLWLWLGLGMGTVYSGTAGAWAASGFRSATGAVSVVGTNGATFYITGVQLERNTTATPFEWIPYGTELALCQRYFQVIVSGSGYFCNAAAQTSTNAFGMYTLPVTMRTAPTGSVVSGTNFYRFLANDTDDFVDAVTVNGQTPNSVIIGNSTQISNTQGRPGIFTAQNAASFVAAQAEL